MKWVKYAVAAWMGCAALVSGVFIEKRSAGCCAAGAKGVALRGYFGRERARRSKA